MLSRVIAQELIRRHGCGAMTGKIKPVHIANGLFRETLGAVGRTTNLKYVLIYTAAGSTEEQRQQAMNKLLDRSKENWGRLAEEATTKEGALGKQVLPMLRALLGTDGAVFGKSIDQSSLTSSTGNLVTSDPSDEHAGAFLKALWSLPTNPSVPDSALLTLLRSIIDPDRDLNTADDLTVLLAPLAEGVRERKPDEAIVNCQDLQEFQEAGAVYDPVLWELRLAADMLAVYEQTVRPNAMATLERIVSLGSLTIFFYLATRGRVWANLPVRPLLLQATGKPESPIARASEESVQQLIVRDAKQYLTLLLKSILEEIGTEPDSWLQLWDAERIWQELTDATGVTRKPRFEPEIRELTKIVAQREEDANQEEVLDDIIDKINEKDSLVDYLRLLGLRSGLLYPQQKNPRKRVCPEDRVIEVLVAGTINVVDEFVEFQEFLERLWKRFGIITGGHPEDEFLLSQSGISRVSSKYLRQNADAFLKRLEDQGFAKRMADGKALVGLVETGYINS
ncbi:hypothetical protein C7B76_27865 [filamentous cyanobacterium CCP2]|nr:hypothetical protein C7B76_27865 [filamentous cyanobacterium CCP2]